MYVVGDWCTVAGAHHTSGFSCLKRAVEGFSFRVLVVLNRFKRFLKLGVKPLPSALTKHPG